MVLPGIVAVAIAWFYVRPHQHEILRMLVDPTSLLWIAVALGVAWLIWMVLIWTTYARSCPRDGRRLVRVAGILAVVIMCGVVTAPMAVGARYAMVQRDLVTSVFSNEKSVTTPEVTKANPWGKRKRVNLLLLGGDGKVGRPGIRTDSLMLASIDVKTGKTILFSLPRNLQSVPFKAGSKLADLYPDGFDGDGDEAEYFLNAVYRNIPALHPGVLGRTDNEGADAVKLAVSGALGIPVDYYMLVNLGGFRQIVDAIGGITVNINERVPIGGNTDAHIPPDDYLEPGPDQRLNGFNALWFTRGRYGSTDYKRMERQRCAINAIVAEADPVTLLKRYTALAHASKRILRTDIPQRLLPDFVDLALSMKDEPLKSVVFERGDDFDPNDPNYDYVHETVAKALHPPAHHPSPGGTTTGGPSGDASPSGPDSEGPGGTSTAGPVTDATEDCAYDPVGSDEQ